MEKQGQGRDRFTESISKTIVFEMAYFVVVTWLRDWNVTVRNQSRHYRQKTCEFNTDALYCCEKATQMTARRNGRHKPVALGEKAA